MRLKDAGCGLALAALLLAGCSQSSTPPAESKPAARSQTAPPPSHGSEAAAPASRDPSVPPYHQTAEAAKPFPELMPVSRYRDYPVLARAYQVAHRRPEVLAQQPCYCYCEKFGHGSLLDCFASDHGAT
ncbi:MAG: PCYCGC motif-containing (lipo)protein [Candidatus Acidiferrales bacterium]